MANKKVDDDKVIVKLKKEYLSSEKRENKYKNICLILIIALSISLIITIFLSFDSVHGFINNSDNDDISKISEIKELLNNQWIYGNNYDDLDREIEEKMYYGMTTFDEDPYTTYMSIDDMDYFVNSIDKIQLGIGISYYKEFNGYPYVLEVYKDSGAYNGGIKKGDRIVAIDGHDTISVSDDKIKEYVLGDEGTFVKVDILRDNQKLSLDCERKVFDSTAHAELYGDIVVLTLSSFGTNTAQTISNELKDYKNYHKLIIDLRDDTGGYQDALLKIAGLFLENNTLVMKEIDKKGNETKFYADNNEHYNNFDDIVIITNENTASAAEVFAICMKEQHQNTTLVGKETFGKGVVQTSYQLSDGSFLKVTISYWTSPSGVPLKDSGIKPDIELDLDEAFYGYKYDFNINDSYAYDSVSSFVTTPQLILKYLGYPVERTDGYFDKSFETALNMFKADNNLEQNGILDKTTYEKIFDSFYICDKDEQLDAALDIINR